MRVTWAHIEMTSTERIFLEEPCLLVTGDPFFEEGGVTSLFGYLALGFPQARESAGWAVVDCLRRNEGNVGPRDTDGPMVHLVVRKPAASLAIWRYGKLRAEPIQRVLSLLRFLQHSRHEEWVRET